MWFSVAQEPMHCPPTCGCTSCQEGHGMWARWMESRVEAAAVEMELRGPLVGGLSVPQCVPPASLFPKPTS